MENKKIFEVRCKTVKNLFDMYQTLYTHCGDASFSLSYFTLHTVECAREKV